MRPSGRIVQVASWRSGRKRLSIVPSTLALKSGVTTTSVMTPALAPATLTSWPLINPRASSKITSKRALDDPWALVPSTTSRTPAALSNRGEGGEASHGRWSWAGLHRRSDAETSVAFHGADPSADGGVPPPGHGASSRVRTPLNGPSELVTPPSRLSRPVSDSPPGWTSSAVFRY